MFFVAETASVSGMENTNPCDHPNCDAEATREHSIGIGYAMYCAEHYDAAEAARLSRIRQENRIAFARRGGRR